MKLHRLYQNTQLTPGMSILLDDYAKHHLLKVLRFAEGRDIVLFNGDGMDYVAKVVRVKKDCEVEITAQTKNTSESKLDTTLVQGIAKGEKMDYILQKSVELGVNNIIPMDSERAVVRLKGDKVKKRLEHWRKIILHACEQSGRSVVPKLFDIHTFDQVLDLNLDNPFILHHRADKTLLSYEKIDKTAIIIGPEGGLSALEIQRAIDKGCKPLLLGQRILRTETASLAALANMQLLWGC